MRRYLYAYALWFAFVVACSVAAVAWYRHVENIGWEELRDRLTEDDSPRDQTGFMPGGKL